MNFVLAAALPKFAQWPQERSHHTCKQTVPLRQPLPAQHSAWSGGWRVWRTWWLRWWFCRLVVLFLLSRLPPAAGSPSHFSECRHAHVLVPWPSWLVGWPGGCLITRREGE